MEKNRRRGIPVMLVMALVFFSGCSLKPHSVHISSDPSGALVFLNDKLIGETPFDATIKQRTGDYNVYTFRLVKENYVPAKKMFKEELYQEKVDRVVPSKLHFILEEREKYQIAVSSEPSGAVVTLNGDVVGETPFTLTVRERIGNPRVFQFVATKDGYQRSEMVVREFLPEDNGATFKFPEALNFALEKVAE